MQLWYLFALRDLLFLPLSRWLNLLSSCILNFFASSIAKIKFLKQMELGGQNDLKSIRHVAYSEIKSKWWWEVHGYSMYGIINKTLFSFGCFETWPQTIVWAASNFQWSSVLVSSDCCYSKQFIQHDAFILFLRTKIFLKARYWQSKQFYDTCPSSARALGSSLETGLKQCLGFWVKNFSDFICHALWRQAVYCQATANSLVGSSKPS